jgi:hypothetical protein
MQDNQTNRLRFTTVMDGMASIYGGVLSKSDMQMRFLCLQEYSLEEIQQAATKLIKKREKNFPAVPTVEEMIDAIHI